MSSRQVQFYNDSILQLFMDPARRLGTFLMLSEQERRDYLHWGKTLPSKGIEHRAGLTRSRLTKSGSEPPTGKLSNRLVTLLVRDAFGGTLEMDVI